MNTTIKNMNKLLSTGDTFHEKASNLLDIMALLNKEENITFLFSTHDQRLIDQA
jgi:putative ABC transport system ATP-binding protein